MNKNKWIQEKMQYFRKNYTLGEFAEPAYIIDFIEQSLEECWSRGKEEGINHSIDCRVCKNIGQSK